MHPVLGRLRTPARCRRPGRARMFSLDGSTTTSSGSSNVTGQPRLRTTSGRARRVGAVDHDRVHTVDTAAPLQPSWSRGNRRWRNGRVLRQPGRMESFSHDGLTFDVTDRGPADGSVAILLHGFPQSAARVVRRRALPHRSRGATLAPDQRGYSPVRGRPCRRSIGSNCSRPTSSLWRTQPGWNPSMSSVTTGGRPWLRAGGAHPERVTSLTTLSVPHPRAFAASMLRSTQLLRSWYMLAFQIPRFERLVVRRQGAVLRARAGREWDARRPGRPRIRPHDAARGVRVCAELVPRAPFGGGGLTPEVTVPTTHVWSTAGLGQSGRVDGPLRHGPVFVLQDPRRCDPLDPRGSAQRTAEIILLLQVSDAA